MFQFSKRSLENLKGVHPVLIAIVVRALSVSDYDFTVVEGLRTPERQKELVARGVSWTNNSYHLAVNGFSHAVDLYPYYDGKVQVEAPQPVFAALADAMFQAAKELNVPIVWGRDWDGDGDYSDQKYADMYHFQIER